MTVLKIQTPLDETDISILKSIEAEPEKVSTRELSRKLDIPDRTVRYRLAKLKEKKLICPQKIQTYERKIGLGERLLFLQSNTEKEEDLIKVLEETDLFYYFSPTYGRYDGFVVYCMYPLVAPRMILQLAEELKEHDLVRDFYIFDLVDYTTKGAEVSPFLPGSTWEWEDWSKEIEKIMKKGCKLDLE
ncbi:MAG: winged helix-turn-helix domain-containing protein, partial [Candidatus Hodarchaeota archaeon]